MKSILAYADRQSLFPGEEIEFKVSTENIDEYDLKIVRLKEPSVGVGEDFPDYKPIEMESELPKKMKGRKQETPFGSYAIVENKDLFKNANNENIIINGYIYPTLIKDEISTIFAITNNDSSKHYKLSLSNDGFQINSEDIEPIKLENSIIKDNRWYFIEMRLDLQKGTGNLSVTGANSTQRIKEKELKNKYEFQLNKDSLAEYDTIVLAASLDKSSPVNSFPKNCFNGKIDNFNVLTSKTKSNDREDFEPVLKLDGSANNMSKQELVDDVNGFNAQLINFPTRAVTGINWDGKTTSFHVDPEAYSAVHFHEDDLYDSSWESDFKLKVPKSWDSGVYAAYLRSDKDDREYYVPFILRASKGNEKKCAFLVSTTTYAAYANMNLRVHAQFNELIHGRLTVTDYTDWYMVNYPELGLSCYDIHRDGSVVYYSSMKRPVTNFRPTGRIYKMCMDLLIIAWLERSGIEYDVIADEDLHREGYDSIKEYTTVITSSHPEYYSANMLDSLDELVNNSGRLMYLGGNGFFWVTGYHDEYPGIVEVRRNGKFFAWSSYDCDDPFLSFTGEQGGTWGSAGRHPEKLAGVGFVLQGFDTCEGYRRSEDSYDDRVRFIFDGIDDEVIGDFGILQGGAAGYEMDNYNVRNGSPQHGLVLASSENHSNLYEMLEVKVESYLDFHTQIDKARIRADIVFFETPSGGAVFSVGSIAWCGSFSVNNYENNIKKLSDNVLHRFMDPTLFTYPD